jgi:HEPN domain-containing protein
MEPDPALVAYTKEWLSLAGEDLVTAELSLAASPPLLRSCLFHCQQCAEKALKAFLAWHDVPFRKTHSLEELGEASVQIDPTLAPLLDRLVPLSNYAVRFRYPGAPWRPDFDEARESLGIARGVVDFVFSRLSI